MENKIIVKLPSEYLELKSGLIGGKTDDFDEDLIGIYGGPLNLDDIHTCLYGSLRSIITLLRREFNLSLDEIDTFALSALNEAMVKEMNIDEGNSDIEKIVKTYRKNQY